jgi:hypothetical protein
LVLGGRKLADCAHDKTVSNQLLELLKANSGILSDPFTKLAHRYGLGRNRAREFLNDGVKSGAVRLDKEKRKRHHSCMTSSLSAQLCTC